jgi:hypothetical protein
MRKMRTTAQLALATALFAPTLAACSSNVSLSEMEIMPYSRSLFSTPAGATMTTRTDNVLRPVTADDLLSPDGQCAALAPDPNAEPVAPARPDVPPGHPAPIDQPAQPTVPLVFGGIGLQMTECEVVRRAGQPDRFDFGTNQRGERTLVLTYTRGPWPGIYRFAEGRLYSIEGTPAPLAPPKKAPRKKAAKKKQV